MEIIRDFLNNTIPDMNSMEFDLPYIKFVFSDEEIQKMSAIAKLEREIKSLEYLKTIQSNYTNGIKKDEDIFIVVDDYQKFFELLSKLVKKFSEREYRGLLDNINFIRSIWLRMSPSDIDNVNEFLERQLSFLNYDEVLKYSQEIYKKYDEFDIVYENKCNMDWFETNNHVAFSIRRETESEGIDKYLNLSCSYHYYKLPIIHYAFTKENDEMVCYIYAIQSMNNMEKDEVIKERIQPLRKELRNKYVSPDFIISLKLFTDFLKDQNITNIKVPLLQVFNYTYHEHLSDSVNKAYLSYDDKDELEKEYNDGNLTDKVLDYIHDKNMYYRFVDKQDIISKNKTERLLNTFIIMNEKYDNIEFMNEPFIEGDYLIIKNKINKKIK